MNDQERMETERQELIAGVVTLFGELFILDLESGSYRIYKMDQAMSQVVSGSDFEKFNYDYGVQLIHPEDLERYSDAFKLNNLKRRIQEGKKRVAIEVRRKNLDGEYHWCELIATLIEGSQAGCGKMIMTFRDIHEIRAARQEERTEIERFRNAVNNTYAAIYEGEIYSNKIRIWKNPGDKIKDFNAEPTIDEQVEWSANTSVHPDYREEFKRILSRESIEREFRGGRKEIFFEIPRLGQDGTYRWFSFQLQLLEMTETSIHIMYYIKDVDDVKKEEKRKQEELQQALNLAEQASAAKTEFLSRISHDIRTPMNAIIGMTTIAGENTDNPHVVEDCLGKIDVSARFLLSLINDILDMSKIESGKMTLIAREIDFRELVQNVATICKSQAEGKKQIFKMKLGDGIGRYYMADSLRLNQIFLNLTGNALKYTPEGGKIRFLLEGSEIEDGKQWITVKIADDGIGMSEEFLRRLFEPFEQENSSRGGRVFEGTGLGLSITHQLVKLMEGTISVKSKLDKGSTFTVKLPLDVIEKKLPGAGNRVDEKQELKTIKKHGRVKRHEFHHEKILLVEDNEINMQIANTLLCMQDLVVDMAKNGQEALLRFSKSAPGEYRAILMDIRMPVMDGLEATRKIRALNRDDAGTVPIIAMSANAFEDEHEEAMTAGISDYLNKPVDAEDMYHRLELLFAK